MMIEEGMMKVFFVLPPELIHLKGNPDVIRKVSAAYNNQAGRGGGWGFTVKLEGLSVRFDMPNEKGAGMLNGEYAVVYTGYVEGNLNEGQMEQLRLNLARFEKGLNERLGLRKPLEKENP